MAQKHARGKIFGADDFFAHPLEVRASSPARQIGG
jgi:hypothetical protein